MTIKVLKTTAAKADWWHNLPAKQRQAYLAKHPNSRYGRTGKAPPTEHKPRRPITLKQAQKRKHALHSEIEK